MASQVKTDTAENFVTSIFKFSIVTFVSMGFYMLAFVITNFFVKESTFGQASLFMDYTKTFMTIGILGLDQALMRFYHEPPGGGTKNSLFRQCIYVSGSIFLLLLLLGSTLFMAPLYRAMGFQNVGQWVIPLLFLNALFYMMARYFNVLYRMEMNVRAYTIQGVLLQFFLTLFYLFGAFFKNPNVAMILCSVLGFGAFALALMFIRRKTLRPRKGDLNPTAYKTILPFGLAVAPTAMFVTINAPIPKSIIISVLGSAAAGIYAFAYMMSNVVAMVQGGFAAFWAPYMYKNYKTEQARILRVHEYLNFIILAFFSVLVAFEDIIFWVFANYRESMTIFPLLMMSAVFNILCETTVHGNAIARRPVFDTIGIGIGIGVNIGLCAFLVPRWQLIGAGVAIMLGNGVAYLLRTFTAQRLYRSIPFPGKTAFAILVGMALAVAGTQLHAHFVLKGLCSLAALGIYSLLYRKELLRCVRIALSIAKGIFKRKPQKD